MKLNPKILLVDDEADFTALLAENLKEAGFEVQQVNDPTAAHAAARSFRPDICIIDLVMPRMDGGDVVTAIHSDFMLAKTPVLMLTALVEENPNKPGEIQMNGGLPFISKTSSLETIISAAKSLI
jgi:DNA-binding response OmpR family regulator